jgi:hypothetical protein
MSYHVETKMRNFNKKAREIFRIAIAECDLDIGSLIRGGG